MLCLRQYICRYESGVSRLIRTSISLGPAMESILTCPYTAFWLMQHNIPVQLFYPPGMLFRTKCQSRNCLGPPGLYIYLLLLFGRNQCTHSPFLLYLGSHHNYPGYSCNLGRNNIHKYCREIWSRSSGNIFRPFRWELSSDRE